MGGRNGGQRERERETGGRDQGDFKGIKDVREEETSEREMPRVSGN